MEFGGPIITHCKTYYRAMVVKSMWYWRKDRHIILMEIGGDPRNKPLLHLWPIDSWQNLQEGSKGRNDAWLLEISQ